MLKRVWRMDDGLGNGDDRLDDGLDFDVVIVGGGLVGASLAAALAGSGVTVAVVEADDVNSDEHISFDDRTIALTYNAKQIYGGDVWEKISSACEPIREIHISERKGFGMTHLHHTDSNTEALGYVIASRTLGTALHECIKAADNITVLCPATVKNLAPQTETNRVTVSHRENTVHLTARLVVIADGGRSLSPSQTGIAHAADRDHYDQRAIVCLVRTDRDHNGRAFERFTAEGPLALLPFGDRRYALVWTTARQNAPARMALTDHEFATVLQETFGDRAGQFAQPTARKSYPLQKSRATTPVARRTVAIGNAAHRVHPVAGQGFNLGLRDVAALADIVCAAGTDGRDIGGAETLAEYAAARKRDTTMVTRFTDTLIHLFTNPARPIALARNLALVGIELCPPAKRFLLRRTMGLRA